MSSLLGIQLPEWLGDPAGLRDLARQLRGAATQVGSLEHDLRGTARGITFEGPAGDAFRSHVDGLGSGLAGAANELQGLAGRVDAAADAIEAEQQRLARELREQQAAASGGGD